MAAPTQAPAEHHHTFKPWLKDSKYIVACACGLRPDGTPVDATLQPAPEPPPPVPQPPACFHGVGARVCGHCPRCYPIGTLCHDDLRSGGTKEWH